MISMGAQTNSNRNGPNQKKEKRWSREASSWLSWLKTFNIILISKILIT